MARVLEMEEERWPKICLREEARNILNKTPTAWGKEIIEALGKEAAELLAMKIWKEEEVELILSFLLDEENRRKAEMEMQEDKRRIEESEYWKYYKKSTPGIEGGEYWNEKNVEGGRKETWVRVRTGNLAR